VAAAGGLGKMDWQSGIFGYRPSLGELFAAFIFALVAERVWRLTSHAWGRLIDIISSTSKFLRSVRIYILVRRLDKIKLLANDDKKIALLFTKRLFWFVWLFGSLTIIFVTLGILNQYSNHIFTSVPYMSKILLIAVVIGSTFGLVIFVNIMIVMSSTMQALEDLNDPPKAIEKLEARIHFLISKGRQGE
jgi:hypothetical protein